MKKKWFTVLTAVALVLCATFGMLACKPEAAEPVTIDGFDVKSSVSVTVGDTVDIESPRVSDSTGASLELSYDVTDPDGAYVDATSGSFVAEKVGNYVITYHVTDSSLAAHTKTTTVTVTGLPPTETTVVVTTQDRTFATVGTPFTVGYTVTPSDKQATVTVKDADNADVAVTEGTFTPSKVGVHTVTVSADGKSESITVYARAAAVEGEIEIFDENWKALETFRGGNRTSWDIVGSSACGIKTKFGTDGTFAKIEYAASANDSWQPVYIFIRGDAQTYSALADAGYTHATMRVYAAVDGVDTIQCAKFTGSGHAAESADTLIANAWTEISVPLKTAAGSGTRGFVDAVMSCDGGYNFLSVQLPHNKAMTLYIDDMYVTRASGIAAKNATGNVSTGVSYTVADFFTLPDGVTAAYTVSVNGSMLPTADTFIPQTAGDTVTLTASSTAVTHTGAATVTLTAIERTSEDFIRLKGTTTLQLNTITEFAAGGDLASELQNVASAQVYPITYSLDSENNYAAKATIAATASDSVTATVNSGVLTFNGLTEAGDYKVRLFKESGSAFVLALTVYYDPTDEITFVNSSADSYINQGGTIAPVAANASERNAGEVLQYREKAYFKVTNTTKGVNHWMCLTTAHGKAYYDKLLYTQGVLKDDIALHFDVYAATTYDEWVFDFGQGAFDLVLDQKDIAAGKEPYNRFIVGARTWQTHIGSIGRDFSGDAKCVDYADGRLVCEFYRDGLEMGDLSMYIGNIRCVEGPEWVDSENLYYQILTNAGKNVTISVVENNDSIFDSLDEKSGNYLKIEFSSYQSGDPIDQTYSIKPLHSWAYYEQYKDTYNIAFDSYMSDSNVYDGGWLDCGSVGWCARGTWLDAPITLSRFFDENELIRNDVRWAYGNDGGSPNGANYSAKLWGKNVTFYMGNVRAVKIEQA